MLCLLSAPSTKYHFRLSASSAKGEGQRSSEYTAITDAASATAFLYSAHRISFLDYLTRVVADADDFLQEAIRSLQRANPLSVKPTRFASA